MPGPNSEPIPEAPALSMWQIVCLVWLAGVTLVFLRFVVMLIPYTLYVTTLGDCSVGDEVNLEYDILAKHLVRLAEIYREQGID